MCPSILLFLEHLILICDVCTVHRPLADLDAHVAIKKPGQLEISITIKLVV